MSTTLTEATSLLVISAVIMFAFALTTSIAFAKSGPNSPTLTHDNPSSCLGAERAARTSSGGDRAHGAFSPAQAETVKDKQPYGQWLKGWMNSCQHSPAS